MSISAMAAEVRGMLFAAFAQGLDLALSRDPDLPTGMSYAQQCDYLRGYHQTIALVTERERAREKRA